MTESEARQKWCPFARVLMVDRETNEFTLAGNRITDVNSKDERMWPAGARCIASDCMAWRTVDVDSPLPSSGLKYQDGYCGLAGKP